jgi:hypothetical protein
LAEDLERGSPKLLVEGLCGELEYELPGLRKWSLSGREQKVRETRWED